MGSFDLLSTVEQGGCSAKISAQQLETILKDQKFEGHPNLLVGTNTSDDACVWKLNEQLAIIQTTDFFPPICSDAYEFGQIAAANALSDVYAMGGTPITALNLVMFPANVLDLSILSEILRGGADKIRESGAVVAGGHSIDDETIKYGLAVTGVVDPKRILANSNAKVGELLILTKPLGAGILAAAKRFDQVEEAHYRRALENMKKLNKVPAEVMQEFNVGAATDVTGFSLMGHAMEMARASEVALRIDSTRVPILDGVYQLADEGCLPCALFKNIDHIEGEVAYGDRLDYNLKMVMYDAQTSGGILMSVAKEQVNKVLEELHQRGVEDAAIIGEVVSYSGNKRINLE